MLEPSASLAGEMKKKLVPYCVKELLALASSKLLKVHPSLPQVEQAVLIFILD